MIELTGMALIEHSSNFEYKSSFIECPLEYTLESRITPADQIKSRAHQIMAQLEGWCTKQKADVLIEFLMMINAKTVVEIGVFGGKSLLPMASTLKALGENGHIYGIDPWTSEASLVGMEGDHKDWWGHVNHDSILQALLTKIEEFDLYDQVTLIRKTSEEAFPIHHIDLLHIDGNHSDETSLFDVKKWVPFVRSGGVIAFDDLNWDSTSQAAAWLDEHCIRFAEFYDENIWGIWIKP